MNDDDDTRELTTPASSAPPPSSAKVTKFGIYLVVLLGVVAMCMFSAFMSIKTLLETKDIPATTYAQEKQTGPHGYVG